MGSTSSNHLVIRRDKEGKVSHAEPLALSHTFTAGDGGGRDFSTRSTNLATADQYPCCTQVSSAQRVVRYYLASLRSRRKKATHYGYPSQTPRSASTRSRGSSRSHPSRPVSLPRGALRRRHAARQARASARAPRDPACARAGRPRPGRRSAGASGSLRAEAGSSMPSPTSGGRGTRTGRGWEGPKGLGGAGTGRCSRG